MDVGHAGTEAQHRRLVALINDIALALARGAGYRELGDLIREFCDYAQVHFRTEVEPRGCASSPHCFRQVGEHENCAARALDFSREYINRRDVPVRDFFAYVSTWFTGHTLGGYLQKKGSGAGQGPGRWRTQTPVFTPPAPTAAAAP